MRGTELVYSRSPEGFYRGSCYDCEIKINSLYKFSFIDLVINLIALRYRKITKNEPLQI